MSVDCVLRLFRSSDRHARGGGEGKRSLLLLAGDDPGLGGTLDPLSLALDLLGHLATFGSLLVDDFVLLKYS